MYSMKKKYYADQLNHVTLAELMPFYCSWLDDGEGNPCPYSVMIAPVIFAVSAYNTRKDEDWKN